MATSSIYALIHKLERDGGVWFAKGGTNALVSGMARHFERIGGTIRLGDPVEAIESDGARVTAVRTKSGWRGVFDAVATNADVVHSYGLIEGHRRGPAAAARLRRKRFSLCSSRQFWYARVESWQSEVEHDCPRRLAPARAKRTVHS